jgi:hypothetical protein
VTESDIEKLLSDLKVPFAVVANVTTGEIQQIGDLSSIQPTDLLKSLFGDEKAVAALNESLEGQPTPQSWSQGDVSVVVCKPKPDVIVGLFDRTTLGAVERYNRMERRCETVTSAWR